MNDEQNQDFEKLQRLLKLKRHEQPHPRFFNNFSGQVTARIRAGDVGRLDSVEDVVMQTPWLKRLWQAIEGKPAISGIFAAGVCGLLTAGLFLTERVPTTLPSLAGNEPAPEAPATGPLLASGSLAVPLASSTNPTSSLPNGSLFNTLPNIQTINASGLPLQYVPTR